MMTIIEKIIAQHSNQSIVKPGILWMYLLMPVLPGILEEPMLLKIFLTMG